MHTYIVKTTKIYGTPVFVTQGNSLSLRQVYGAHRSDVDGLWYFPAFHPVHAIVLRDFKALGLSLQLSESAQKWVERLETVPEFVQKGVLPPSFVFKTPPYKHQHEALVHLLYFWRAALFYACGLGKTKIIIDWQRATGCWPLIFCPKNVLSVWAREPLLHGINQEFRLVDATTKTEKMRQIDDAADYQGLVVTYDTMWRHHEQLAEKVPYDAIVADESHKIKNPQSKRTQAALRLADKARRRVIMSGTATLGDPRDVYSQMRFLGTCFMPENFWKFKHTFCVTSPHNAHIVTGFQNLHVLRQRVSLIALHRKKEDCLELPERLIIDLHVSLAPKQQRIYNTLMLSKSFDELAQALLRDEHLLTGPGMLDIPNIAILINKLIQISCGFVYTKPELPDICIACSSSTTECVRQGIKPYTARCHKNPGPVKSLIEYTPDNGKRDVLEAKLDEILVDHDNKVIIWGQYTPELDLIEAALNRRWDEEPSLKEYHVRVDGATRNNRTLIDSFNTDHRCRVYLGQVETGEGITLNAANYMIYYSLPWKFGAYEQSLDRNHRVGQRRSITVFRLVGKNTVDHNIALALRTKSTLNHIVISTVLCNRCADRFTCEADNIEPFSPRCRYARQFDRPITRLN